MKKKSDYMAEVDKADSPMLVLQEPAMAYHQTVDISVKVPYVEGINMAEVEHRLAAYARMILMMPETRNSRTSDRVRQGMTLVEAETYLDSIVQKEHHIVSPDFNGMREKLANL